MPGYKSATYGKINLHLGESFSSKFASFYLIVVLIGMENVEMNMTWIRTLRGREKAHDQKIPS